MVKAAERARHRLLAADFGVLAATIVVTIGIVMLAEPLVIGRIGGQIVISLPLLAALYFVARDTRRAAVGFVALGVAATLGVLAAALAEPWLLALDAALRAAIVAGVTGWVIHEVLRAERVSVDTIAGAICAYLLVGFVYSNLYLAVEALAPGSLRDGGRPMAALEAGEHPFRLIPSVIYFSYVTLTTVAYGDILPVGPVARFFSMTEGMIGQLYPAIFIARLISLNVSQRG